MQTLRIFPLGQVVLFPTLSVPLYIFEPRYREMVAHALADDRAIGMIAVPPQYTDEMAGDPPTFQVGCGGEIAHADERPDGTYTILLRATRRFRVVAEPPREHLYRVAEVEWLDDPCPAETDEQLAARRREIVAGLETLLGGRREEESELEAALDQLSGVDHPRFVNAFSQLIDFDVLEKQRLLEAASVPDRYDVLRDLMRFRLAARGEPGGPGSNVVH